MPCTTNDNDSDEADAFLHVLYTNGSITVSMFVIIFAETFLVTCFLYPELAFLRTMSSPANEWLLQYDCPIFIFFHPDSLYYITIAYRRR
jgi:hypothetical protein